MASRAQLLAEVIRPALDTEQIVISDRFLLANVVYQGHAGGLDVDRLFLVSFSNVFVGPDLQLTSNLRAMRQGLSRNSTIPDLSFHCTEHLEAGSL